MTFEHATEPLRGQLLGLAYRMLGSWDEAEDAVQESYLRAWRAWDNFERRSSPRTWLYSITTNACLTMLEGRRRRALPSGLGSVSEDLPETLPATAWIQPYADDRDDVRLAAVASLQLLTPHQRAVLLLRDVFGFPAADVADILELTTAAVKSSLQRARRRLAETAARPDDVVEPTSPVARRLLDIYIAAFERGDIESLIEVLRADTVLEVLPGTAWFDGLAACVPVLRQAIGSPGDWRMLPTVANGQPAVVVWLHGEPMGIAVLDARADGIAAISVFTDPELASSWATRTRGHLGDGGDASPGPV